MINCYIGVRKKDDLWEYQVTVGGHLMDMDIQRTKSRAILSAIKTILSEVKGIEEEGIHIEVNTL